MTTNKQRNDRYAKGFELGDLFMRERGACQPTFIFEGSDGMPGVFPLGWKDEDEHARAKRLVRLVAVCMDAVAITLVSESWFVTRKPRDGETDAQFRARRHTFDDPSKSPDRREGVCVAVAERGADGTITMGMEVRAIHRDAEDKFTGLDETDTDAKEEVEGWLSGCVPPDTIPTELREISRVLLRTMGVKLETIKPGGASET
jgi:hypothetical protein